MTLIAAMLGSMTGCLVTARGHAGAGGGPPPPGPGPSEPSSSVVTGTVTDSRNHQPIGQVAIDVLGPNGQETHISGHTDASGHYTSPEVPPGPHWIRVRRNGFKGMWRKDIELPPGTTEINMELDPEDGPGPR